MQMAVANIMREAEGERLSFELNFIFAFWTMIGDLFGHVYVLIQEPVVRGEKVT